MPQRREDIFTSPHDGRRLRRHDGIVHIVNGTLNVGPTSDGGWHLIMRCEQRARINSRVSRNKLVEDAATCLACIADE